MSIEGEKTEKQVVNWLDEHYPYWRIDWMESGSKSVTDLPFEFKMISAFRVLEHNMINGGRAQFLWNCFGNWRHLIEIAREGYKLLDGATEQLKALDSLATYCERNEKICEQAIQAEDGSLENFKQFMKHSHSKNDDKWEMLLWSGTDVYWKRLKWLALNKVRIIELLEQSEPTD
ncbi:MAG: hypothetical protein AB8G95_16905 [Anaerolineae bacterium]